MSRNRKTAKKKKRKKKNNKKSVSSNPLIDALTFKLGVDGRVEVSSTRNPESRTDGGIAREQKTRAAGVAGKLSSKNTVLKGLTPSEREKRNRESGGPFSEGKIIARRKKHRRSPATSPKNGIMCGTQV